MDSNADRACLIQHIVPDIKRELEMARPEARKSLWGLCFDLGPAPSTEEIDQVR